MKKTWLFILPWDIGFPGGVNQVVINLINALQKNHEIKPKLLINQNNGSINSLATTPVDYLSLANPCWSPGILGTVKYLIKLPLFLFNLHSYISDDIKCINPHYPTLNIINFILYKNIGFYTGKIILSFHGTDIILIKKTGGMEKWLWFYIFKHVDNMVCCSQKLADELIGYINNPVITCKISVIHNGIDEKTMNSQFIESNSLSKEINKTDFILSIGTFTKIKGQDVLIHAFAKLKAVKNPIKLILIGRNDDALLECRILAQRLNCVDRIIFIENLEHKEVLNYLQKAKVFCLPSRYESFGIVLLEAGFYSCPVIASNVGGIPEIIEDGYDGFLVHPENIDELADKLDVLLNDRELAQQLGTRLRKKVIKRFTWEIACSKYLNLLLNK